MSQANAAHTPDSAYTATPAEMARMIDGLDAALSRPLLSEYERWLSAGNDPQHAAECRAYERRRSSLMRSIYGEAA
jgi:hypothetical protein